MNNEIEEMRAMYRHAQESFRVRADEALERTQEFARSVESAIGEISPDEALDAVARRFREEIDKLR